MKKFYFPKSLDFIDSKGILFNREHFTWYYYSRSTIKPATVEGSGVKNTCWSYLKDSIVVVSRLAECQSFALFRNYRHFNVLALWLFYSNLRGHFCHFLHFFWIRSWDVGTGTSKFCIKVHFNGLFWMKNFDLEIFVNFGWFRQI